MTRQLEPAWDDAARHLALGLQKYDDDCCPGCGMHESVLDDPDGNVFTFEEKICRVCAAQDVFGRVVADAHAKADKNLGENVPPRVHRSDDGHHIYLRRLSAEEAKRRKSPS